MRPFNNKTSLLRRRKSALERVEYYIQFPRTTQNMTDLLVQREVLQDRINNNAPCYKTIKKNER